MYDMRTNMHDDDDYRRDYRHDYRYDYRDDDRYNYRRGRRTGRNYRNYREQDYYEELEMCMEDAKEDARKYEDLAEMAENSQEKNNLMKIAQREKEHYTTLKEMLEK